VTVRFYEDWFVKTFYTTRVARVGELAAAAVVIRGWDVSRVVRVDARTSFYPCRTIATCTTCSMRACGVEGDRWPFADSSAPGEGH